MNGGGDVPTCEWHPDDGQCAQTAVARVFPSCPRSWACCMLRRCASTAPGMRGCREVHVPLKLHTVCDRTMQIKQFVELLKGLSKNDLYCIKGKFSEQVV